jgi:hypothetical protein
MRHAEKPDDPRDPDPSDRGKTRAAKLADYVPINLGFRILLSRQLYPNIAPTLSKISHRCQKKWK